MASRRAIRRIIHDSVDSPPAEPVRGACPCPNVQFLTAFVALEKPRLQA
jgi:hypothetical protein